MTSGATKGNEPQQSSRFGAGALEHPSARALELSSTRALERSSHAFMAVEPHELKEVHEQVSPEMAPRNGPPSSGAVGEQIFGETIFRRKMLRMYAGYVSKLPLC